MSVYKLYVTDSNGCSASWSHTEGFRGKRCLVFPDDVESVIVIENGSHQTCIYVSADGYIELPNSDD